MALQRFRGFSGKALLLGVVVVAAAAVGSSSARASGSDDSRGYSSSAGRYYNSSARAAVKHVSTIESHDRYAFSPKAITISHGTKVSWTNKTDAEHNVTIAQGMKVNTDFKPHTTISITFARAGTYHYHCEYHPYMKGTIVVR